MVTVSDEADAQILRKCPEFTHVATVTKAVSDENGITPDHAVGYDFVFENPKRIRDLFEARAHVMTLLRKR